MTRAQSSAFYGALLCAFIGYASWAPAGEVCNKRQAVVDNLQEKFGETQRAHGLSSDGRVVEIWASERGTWTIISIRPNGWACLESNGRHFEMGNPAGQKRL